MAPKRSADVVGVTMKATKKMVEETLEVSVVKRASSKQHQTPPTKVVEGQEKQTQKAKGKEPNTPKGQESKGRKKAKRRVGGGGGGYTYKRYVYRVLKQVHPEMGVSSKAMEVVDMMMADMFERVAEEAARLAKYAGKATLSAREVQAAVRLVLPGELGKHVVSEGTKAVANYMAAGRGGA